MTLIIVTELKLFMQQSFKNNKRRIGNDSEWEIFHKES